MENTMQQDPRDARNGFSSEETKHFDPQHYFSSTHAAATRGINNPQLNSEMRTKFQSLDHGKMIRALEQRQLASEGRAFEPALGFDPAWPSDTPAGCFQTMQHIPFDWHSCGLSEEYDALLDRKEELC